MAYRNGKWSYMGVIYKNRGRDKENQQGMLVHPQDSNSGAITTCRLKGQCEGVDVTQALSIRVPLLPRGRKLVQDGT